MMNLKDKKTKKLVIGASTGLVAVLAVAIIGVCVVGSNKKPSAVGTTPSETIGTESEKTDVVVNDANTESEKLESEAEPTEKVEETEAQTEVEEVEKETEDKKEPEKEPEKQESSESTDKDKTEPDKTDKNESSSTNKDKDKNQSSSKPEKKKTKAEIEKENAVEVTLEEWENMDDWNADLARKCNWDREDGKAVSHEYGVLTYRWEYDGCGHKVKYYGYYLSNELAPDMPACICALSEELNPYYNKKFKNGKYGYDAKAALGICKDNSIDFIVFTE